MGAWASRYAQLQRCSRKVRKSLMKCHLSMYVLMDAMDAVDAMAHMSPQEKYEVTIIYYSMLHSTTVLDPINARALS